MKVLDDGVALALRARKQAQRDREIRLPWARKARPGWAVLTVTDVGTHVLKKCNQGLCKSCTI